MKLYVACMQLLDFGIHKSVVAFCNIANRYFFKMLECILRVNSGPNSRYIGETNVVCKHEGINLVFVRKRGSLHMDTFKPMSG